MSNPSQPSNNRNASEVQRKRPLFQLGQILSTPGVLEHLDHHGVNAQPFLERHITGDFGDVCADDAKENLFAIEQGLYYFDPGTQGEHKLIRGFIPTTTHSLHRIYDARFVPAIHDFCTKDRSHMAQYREQAFEALPFNIDNMPAFDNNE